MWIVKYRVIFFILSLLLVIGAVTVIAKDQLNWGIDFTGGTILEVEYPTERPAVELVRSGVDGLDLGPISVQLAGERGVILRLRALSEEEHQKLVSALPQVSGQLPVEKRFSAIGPAMGR